MIRLAISSSPNGKMTLNEIYNYICNAFPYYKEAGKGWMVRHIYNFILILEINTYSNLFEEEINLKNILMYILR